MEVNSWLAPQTVFDEDFFNKVGDQANDMQKSSDNLAKIEIPIAEKTENAPTAITPDLETIPALKKHILLEIKLNQIENELSLYSLCPIILPGIAKILIGLAQAVSAIAISIIFSVPACIQDQSSQKNFFFAVKHIKHGIGNIIAGSIEAIPIVGTIFILMRLSRPPYTPYNCSMRDIMKHPKFKFMPYDHNTLDLFFKEKIEYLLKDPASHNLTVSANTKMTKDRF